MAPRKRREFTAEQKSEAVRLVRSVGNLARVAWDLDLHPSVLHKWVKQVEIDADKGPAVTRTPAAGRWKMSPSPCRARS